MIYLHTRISYTGIQSGAWVLWWLFAVIYGWQPLFFIIYQTSYLYPPPNEVGGGVYWIHLVRPSVRLSIRPSVRLSVDDMVSGA